MVDLERLAASQEVGRQSNRASDCIPDNGPTSVRHKASHEAQPTREYLRDVASEYDLNRLLTKNSEWAYAIDYEDDVYGKSIGGTRRFCIDRLREVYKLVNPSLDKSSEYGFNTHGLGHAIWVADTADALLQAGGYDIDTRRRTMYASMNHDPGNLFTRGDHSWASGFMLTKIFPELLEDPAQLDVITDAIVLHNNNVAEPYMYSQGCRTMGDAIAFLRACGPEAAAVIASDKAHVGKERVSWKQNERALEEDKHLLVNLLGETANVSVLGNQFIWELRFDMRVQDTAAHLMQHARPSKNGDGHRAKVSQRMEELYRNPARKAPYSKTWSQDFLELYEERIRLKTLAVFALFPNVRYISVVMQDAKPDAPVQVPQIIHSVDANKFKNEPFVYRRHV